MMLSLARLCHKVQAYEGERIARESARLAQARLNKCRRRNIPHVWRRVRRRFRLHV